MRHPTVRYRDLSCPDSNGSHSSVIHNGADRQTPVALYYPVYHWWPFDHDRILEVRVQTDPAGIVGPIREIITELDSNEVVISSSAHYGFTSAILLAW